MMTTDLFTFVDLFSRVTGNADHLLSRGAGHAARNGANAEEVLDWRLVDDMHPLRFQLMVVCNFAQQWPARVAGIPLPETIDEQLDVAGFHRELAAARSFLETLTPDQFAGRDAVPLTFAIAPDMAPTMDSARWLTVFATTNIYFHLSTAYAILRARGVQLGKLDLFATGL